MTTIKTKKSSPLTGTANGRSVKFSQAAWGWYYMDTKGTEAVEMVRGQVYIVRK